MRHWNTAVALCLLCHKEFYSYEDCAAHAQECEPGDYSDDISVRALELADTVSDMIWGGERGWEIATKSQYQSLLRILRDRLRTHPEA